jgi:hypothetical protein
MTQPLFTSFILMLLLAGRAMAASVGPAGYTNAFATQPPAADWATLSIPGGAADTYDLDSDVNTNLSVTAATISFQTVSNVNNPASQLTNATWSSSGLFIQTRPNVNRYTVLLGKFVNNTGTNAAQINISYQLTMAGALAVEDAGKGTHVYYSLTGLAGSWTPLATLNNLTNTSTFALSTNVALSWPVGGNLFLLWADDNTAVGTDTANEIDNFSLTVTAGAQPSLAISLTAPTNGAVYLSGPPIGAAAAATYGTAPHTVEYFISSGAGNTSFTPAGSSTTPPFNLSLNALVAGTYNIYCVVTDSGAPAENATSTTNTFFVVDPLILTLTAPADGATIDTSVNTIGAATVSGGSAPYSVQFFLDGATNGSPVTGSPYERNFGNLPIGDHTIRATVTDGRRWVSNSIVATVHITGPLSVTLTPTNGTSLNLGSSLVLTAALLGGTSPYTVTFYTNGQPVGSLGGAPFTTNLGALAIGSYTCYVAAVDSSLPAPQQAHSSTNVITVSPSPLLATLTAPVNGQLVSAGQLFSLTATASVGAPVTVSNVEFYVDEVLVGTDASSPYSATNTPALGSHIAYAVATDSLGRKIYTLTNTFTGIIPPTAAAVGPTGYTNDFSTQPPAIEFATLSIPGLAGDNYVMDNDVNALISASNVILRTTSSPGAPPNQLTNAVWASAGFYLQTRPTGNRYTTLMGKFLNQTGTNATQIAVSYLLTIASGGVAEEIGTRGYYSLSGTTGSWINIPAFSHQLTANGSTNLSANVSVNWTNGGNLFLLWADDNASGMQTDGGQQFDNFSLTVTAGLPPYFITTVTTPANNALFVSGTPITAAATAANGSAPFTVEYFTNAGVGNVIFASAGSSATPPYNVSLGTLVAGDYNIYSVVTDSASASTNSLTNAFRVADPITFVLTAPVNEATFDNLTAVTGVTTVSGGTPPYSVQFFLDNSPSGAAVTSAPYERNFGALIAGDHTIRATVTDARGWVSNSIVSTVHITGPLGATLTSPDGTLYNFGTSISVTGTVGGGTAPYATDFYVNNVLAGSVATPPFVVNLGLLPVGTYAAYVHATDSSAPTPQQYNSATNLITVLPNPIIVALTAPTNGQSGIAGQAFSLAATVSVNSPLTITNVRFFYNDAPAGVDTNAPYTGSVASPAGGTGTFYAVATDNLGRTGTSAVNTVNFIVDPLASDAFANRSEIGTPANIAGNNTGATTQGQEPTAQFVSGQITCWGATLWYRWVAPFNGVVTIDTLGSSINTVLSVYTGTTLNNQFGNTLVQRNDNVDASTTASRVSFAAVAGTEYQIQVAGQGGGFCGGTPAQGAFVLHLSMPPNVVITNPPVGAAYLVGTPIPVDVTAVSPAGSVTNVSLYRGNVFVGSLTTPPYSFVVSNAPAGSNSLYAVAIDSVGQIATSAVVRVLVANIGITITTPVEDSYVIDGAPLQFAVFAALPSGAITNVDFFLDGIFLGNDSTAPFSVVWSNAVGGSHRLTATGQDDVGNTYVATPVNFGVVSSFIPFSSNWKYLDNGTDQGTNWITLAFDDSGWSNGLAELGYGDGDEATVVQDNATPGYNANDTDRYITTYFRRSFTVSSLAGLLSAQMAIEYDDGAVVYLNGREIFRTANVPTNHNYLTTTTGQAGEDTIAVALIDPTNFVEGVNVIAAEVHQQAANSSDVSFNVQLIGVPVIIHNVSPEVAITTPTNGQFFLAPSSIPISATASDSDGSVVKVEFFASGVKIGEATNGNPYQITWNNPPVKAHTLTAVATDDQGATTVSAPIPIVVYDGAGTPVAAITSPPDGAVMEGPTNLLITATANAINGVTNVQFLANGVPFANDATPPYRAIWTSQFLSNGLQVVVSDANGVTGVSPLVSVFITIPPTNVIAPTIATQLPPAFATITNLTAVTVRFSERVQNVDASDLLVNGLPATGVSGSGSNYTFTFPQPPYGHVDIAFATGHGITDFGFPDNLPFNEFDEASVWGYELIDRTPPFVLARTPARGATVTNLFEIAVTFSEPVTGVDEADLLVNGVAAFGFSGSGTNYVFNVSQPASGTINITWATNHNIFDTADLPNSFVRTAASNVWSFTLDSRTTFVQSNSVWRFIKGLAEASDPTNAWRQIGFDDSSWSNSAAPFFYGDPYTNFPAGIYGTELTDMRSNYSSIYLRKEFVVLNRNAITNLIINAQSDDGYIAWLNGVEVRRFNAPTNPAYNAISSATATEPNNAGVAYTSATLTNNAVAALVNGVNILAIQAFNDSLSNSTDFGFNAQLYSFVPDFGVVPPRLAFADPIQGDIFFFTNLTITFSEPVTNVDASDLLVNGVPATGLTSGTNTTYVFSFPQPAYGSVIVTWASNDNIVDLDTVAKPFDGTAASAILRYTLINPSAPIVIAQTPLASTTVTGLTSIAVTFSEAVTGVNVFDLLVNGVAATGLTAFSTSNYVFTFPQPAFGTVTVRFTTNSGIQDLEVPANALDSARPANQWNYNLINPVPTVAITSPADGAFVLEGLNVTVNATATDNDGTITQVDFLANGVLFGTDAGAPYSAVASNLTLGSYVLRAVATDNTGIMATSAPVILNVVTSLPIVRLRGPYLQSGSPTGGVVRWRTDQFSDGVVRYGTDFNNLTNVAIETTLTNNHVVQIVGLQPETKYFYAFGSSSFILAGGTNTGGSNYWFTTAPVPGTVKPTRFWVLGDPGTANNNQRAVRDAYYNFVANGGRPADVWLMLGDNAYNTGTDTEYQSALFDMYPETLRNHFFYPVIGNHDAGIPGTGGGVESSMSITFPYLDIFSNPRNGEGGGVPSGSKKYYSFDHANVHFVGLDSMTSGRETNSAQLNWLRDDLANNTQPWVIVYFHHSLYTKGTHNSDTEADLIALRQNFNPILEAYGVDLVLMGHSHVYERSYLLDGHYGLSTTITESMKLDAGNGREEGGGAYRKNEENRGVVYSIVGSSGQALGGTLNHPAHVVSLNLLGSLLVDVNSNRLDAMFLTSTGTTNDHYTLIKRSGARPLHPLDIVAHALGTNQIQLTWTDVATNEFGYYIDRSLDGTNFTRIATNSFNTTSFLDSGLLAGITYYYRVIAYNGEGQSSGSSSSALTGNNPPSLTFIPDVIADVRSAVAFTALGTDNDLPQNQLVYSLGAGAPAGIRLNSTNGFFFWVPSRANAASTNLITVRVTDNGAPALSGARNFTVVVKDYMEVSVGSAILEVGQQTNVTIDLASSTPLTSVAFSLSLPTGRLTSLSLENLVPDFALEALDLSQPNVAAISFTVLPGQLLSGTQQLARLHFTAPIGQSSAFVPLMLSGVTGQRAQAGLAPTVLANQGRVVVVNGQPLLDANLDSIGARTLTLYGLPGTNYLIQTSSVPASPASWGPWRSITLTNLLQTTEANAATNGVIFYRARE